MTEICIDEIGISLKDAITIFLEEVAEKEKIPFEY